jgi:hypothetical protein
VLGFVRHAAAIGEVARVAHHPRANAEEVGVDRHHDVSLVQVVDSLFARVLPRGSRSDGVELVPMRLREVLQDGCNELRERRRCDRLGQDPKAGALQIPLGPDRCLQGGLALAPGPDFAAVRDGLRAVGIVEAEDGALRHAVSRAEAGGMFRVPLDFGRTPHMTLDEHGTGNAGERNGAREKERSARHNFFWLTNIRDDVLGWLLRAGAHAGERQRGAHQLEEIAPALWVVPLRRLFRKLAMEIFAELQRVG